MIKIPIPELYSILINCPVITILKYPLISNTCKGEITIEWWNKHKKLILYIQENVIDYIKVYGSNMDSEMEEGFITSREDLYILWQWLSE